MAFRMNSSKASEGGISLKPEGDYEVIIDSAETKTIQSSGKQCVSLTYIIRNDVQQPCQNGLIFNSIWKKKEPNADDMSVDGYNFGQLMAVAAAAKLPDNKEYASLGDFLAELSGKPIKVHLYHDDYNGKTYEKIDRHSPTDHPEIKHKAKPKPNTAGYAAPQTSFATAANIAPAPAAPSDGDGDYPF